MRDYDADVREFGFELKYLFEVDGVFESAVPRDVELRSNSRRISAQEKASGFVRRKPDGLPPTVN